MKHLMTFPVAGVDYAVYEMDMAQGTNEAIGECNYEQQRILVHSELGAQRKAQVIVHELVHALMFEAGYDDHDEELVNRLGIALLPLIVTHGDEPFDALQQLYHCGDIPETK